MTLTPSLAIGLHPDPQVAKAGLLDRASDWKLILSFEAAVLRPGDIPVMRQTPGDAASSGHESLFTGPACQTYQQCVKLLDMLDFHKHQLVREVCFAMSTPKEGVPA